MRFSVSAVLVISIITLLLVAGCADVKAIQKVGDFGTAFGASPDEQKAIDWFKTTYGDPMANNGKPARFVEPMITSGISDKNLPVDKVTTFPVSGGSVYFFVIYDNFQKGDPIKVSWTYLENGKEVTSVKQEAGGDFGRFIVEFQKPDSGWGKGNQRITVTGDGATASVDFTIGDVLQTKPLPYNPAVGSGAGGGSGAGVSSQFETPAMTPIPPGMTDMKSINNSVIGSGPDKVSTQSLLSVKEKEPMVKPDLGINCIAGFAKCGNNCVDLKTNVNNCGKCGNTCNLANAESSCSNGKCVIKKCSRGVPDPAAMFLTNFENCDNNPLNGCEADLGVDVNNCYSCGNVCPNERPICYCGECLSEKERSQILPDGTVLINGYHYAFSCKISGNP